MSLAPLVVDGKVMVGASGGELGVRGFVAAFDAETGKQLWKTYTMPAPGRARQRNLAAGAISGRPAAARSGSPATTIPRPISPSGAPATAARGWATSGPATISTPLVVALDATTGAIKGHFQYHPNDSWDWDEVSPPILVDYQRDGRTREGPRQRRARRLSLVCSSAPTARSTSSPANPSSRRTSSRASTRRPDGRIVDHGAQARHRQDRRLLPVPVGRQGLAAGRLQPEDADALHPGQREPVHRAARRAGRNTSQGERYTGVTKNCAEYRRRAPTISANCRPGTSTPARRCGRPTCRRQNWGPMLATGGGRAVRGRHQRPHVPRLRRQDRQDAVGVPDRLRASRRTGVVSGRRQAVHRRAVRLGRRRGDRCRRA